MFFGACVAAFVVYAFVFVVPNPATRDAELVSRSSPSNTSQTIVTAVLRRNTWDVARQVIISTGFTGAAGTMYLMFSERGVVDDELRKRLLRSRLALAFFLVYGSFAPYAIERIFAGFYQHTFSDNSKHDPNTIGIIRDAMFGAVGVASGCYWFYLQARARLYLGLAERLYVELQASKIAEAGSRSAGTDAVLVEMDLRRAKGEEPTEAEKDLINLIKNSSPGDWTAVSRWTAKQQPNGARSVFHWLKADWATLEMTALAVLARDCTYPRVVQAALEKCPREELTRTSGLRTSFTQYGFPDDEPLQYIPLQFAARFNPSAGVVAAFLAVEEVWKERQLKTPTPAAHVKLVSRGTRDAKRGGDLALHLAARHNPNLDVKHVLAEHYPQALKTLNLRAHTPFDVAKVETKPAELKRWFVAGGGWARGRSMEPVWNADLPEYGSDMNTATRPFPLEDVSMIHGSEEDVSQVVRVLKQWPTRHDTYLLRYQLQEAVHKSRTSEVFYAYDVTESRPVCLKLMKDFSSFEREIRTRLEQTIAPDCVVEVLGWHTEESCPLSVEVNTPAGRVVRTEEPQWTDCNAKERWPFVLVMAPAERSLLDCFSKEQLAGVNHPVVVATICSILRCVEALHEAGLVHGDLKPRNILRQDHFDLQHTTMPDVDAAAADSVGTDSQNADKWILCDLDATASVQGLMGDKTSSAYAPPECQYDAREKRHRKVGERVPAAKSYDVWSLGIIIFELVSGVRLFRQDLCNDDLSETADRTRLQVWHTIDDEELAPVFEKADSKLVSNEQKQQAKALIRWCLKGDPNERPTVQQMLGHPFLGGKDPPREMPMLYFAFLSHCQADASGTVATLYQLLKRKGLHCWYDMRQRVLTLKGMRKGVCDSDVFIFLLSSRVLDSWFCQQELLCAIEHKKRIQLVVEADPRFNPFDVAQWNAERESYAAQAATAGSSDRRLYSETRSEAGGRVEVQVEPDERYAWQTKQGGKKLAELIAQAIDDNLPKAVTFRRRDFEQDAMLRELCRRNGKELPDEEPQETRPGHPIRVLVIHNERSNNRDSPPQRMHRLLEALEDNGEDDICLCDSSTDLSSVHCVLLLLVPGVLGGATLVALQDALRYDREQQTDRIIAVCDQSWDFRGPEATEAPQDVQACLSSHEAIVFRPRTNDEAGDCHEHPAMMKQLLLKLRMAACSER